MTETLNIASNQIEGLAPYEADRERILSAAEQGLAAAGIEGLQWQRPHTDILDHLPDGSYND